jgi:hypothetical protein
LAFSMLAKYLGTANIIREVTMASTTNNSINVKPMLLNAFDFGFIFNFRFMKDLPLFVGYAVQA